MTTTTPNTIGTAVTVDQWLHDPDKCIAEAKRFAKAEGGKEWEVVIESGGVERVIKRGRVN